MGTPQLNIKDAEATRLARELADLTGEFKPRPSAKPCANGLNGSRRSAQRAMRVLQRRSGASSRKCGPKSKIFQERVRRRGLSKNMLTDDDLYDANGLPK